jgi:hypothetical protein
MPALKNWIPLLEKKNISWLRQYNQRPKSLKIKRGLITCYFTPTNQLNAAESSGESGSCSARQEILRITTFTRSSQWSPSREKLTRTSIYNPIFNINIFNILILILIYLILF